MTNWKINRKSRSLLKYKNSSVDTVQSDNLSAIERFVREIVSNVKDAAEDNKEESIKVKFHLIDLNGDDKKAFLDSIQFNELEDSYRSINKNQENIDQIFLGKDPCKLYSDNTSLRLLVINDSGTEGLTGPELNNNYEHKDSKRFIGLCRSIGNNETGGKEDSGGTWGYGKSVLWANSSTRIVLFNSKLYKEFYDKEIDKHISDRYYGYAKLIDYIVNDTEGYSGDIFFGKNFESEETISLHNQDAIDYSSKIDIDTFSRNNIPGTSTIIVGFEPADNSNDTTDEIGSKIKKAVERYFWPSIIDNKLSVDLQVNQNKISVNPSDSQEIKPFIDLYKKTKKYDFTADTIQKIDVEGPTLFPFNAHIVTSQLILNQSDRYELSNRIAKIRGTRMVIEYYDPKTNKASGQNAYGLALAGELINDCPNIDKQQQKLLGKLLRSSEPIAHHKWDEKEKKLKKYKAGSSIRRINRKISQTFKDQLNNKEVDSSANVSTFLSKLFKLGGSTANENQSKKGVITYRAGQFTMNKEYDGELCQYTHQIKVTVPCQEKFSPIITRHKPNKFKFTSLFSACDEVGKKIRLDSSELLFKITDIKVNYFNTNKNGDRGTDVPFKTKTISPDSGGQFISNIDIDSEKEFTITWESNWCKSSLSKMITMVPNYKWELARISGGS